jgi:hypothetical protein
VQVDGSWRGSPPQLDVRIPGFGAQVRTARASEEFNLVASP